jgi:hypothetical protein
MLINDDFFTKSGVFYSGRRRRFDDRDLSRMLAFESLLSVRPVTARDRGECLSFMTRVVGTSAGNGKQIRRLSLAEFRHISKAPGSHERNFTRAGFVSVALWNPFFLDAKRLLSKPAEASIGSDQLATND